MVHIIERSAITNQLLTSLRTLNFPVGDNNFPTDANNNPVPYGWAGEADAAGENFMPWLSLTPMPGQGQGQTLETLGGQVLWLLNYSLFIAGVNRNQSELLADRARNLLCNLGSGGILTVAGPSAHWVIDGVKCPNMGSNNRVGEAFPYYYTQTDNYQVWVTEGD